jgi:hypothetical protein
MREIIDHKIDSVNEGLTVTAVDQPSEGGASRIYRIEGKLASNASAELAEIAFTDGKSLGLTNESLLAIVEDRLRGFQNGPGACRENVVALTHLESAMRLLEHRHKRIAEAKAK